MAGAWFLITVVQGTAVSTRSSARQTKAWTFGGRQGPLRRHKQLVFFACEGLIAMFDERHPEEDYSIHYPADFENRAIELNRMGALMAKAENPAWMREEGRCEVQGAADMKEAVKEARFMGDPSDPAVQAYWARFRQRKTRVSLHSGVDKAGYPDLPQVDRGKITGKTVGVDGKADLVDTETAMRIRRPARRKQALQLEL